MTPIKRFDEAQLTQADLVIDAVYEGRRGGNAGDDPLPALIGVSNQGGFRYLGTVANPHLIVLTSSFNDPDWPDHLDKETGIVTYYGDNKQPGRGLHETPRNGNVLLRDMFDSLHAPPPARCRIPPILVFGNTGTYRDMVFLGLAVPGSPGLHSMEDLVAVWKVANSRRFQNYCASLTILDVPCVSRLWLNDVKRCQPLSDHCPTAWRQWRDKGIYKPLQGDTSVEHRTRNEQIPTDTRSVRIIRAVYDHFKDRPVAFEACAAALVQLMDGNFVSMDLTRPSRDGGRDAVGTYRIGHGASAILVDFALEAKCYNLANSVGVREVSRLISRLRHRQFGILVTTSYLNTQAYRELREDQHPVVIISAMDIITILGRAGLNAVSDVTAWLESNFAREH